MLITSPHVDQTPISFAAPDIRPSDRLALDRVLDSGWLTTGIECESLEHELSEEVGAPFVVAVSSCTAALEIALDYLQLTPGSKIGVPAWTFVSTALAAHRSGGRIVLLDVDPDTLNVDADSLSRAVSQGLAALIPVHFGGVPVSSEIRRICADSGVPVIEDAAHAFGASDDRGLINGKDVVAACYSFYATKNLSCGEGGALATFDDGLASFAKSFRLHGLSADAWRRYGPNAQPDAALYDLVGPGIKANLPDILAALARSQLVRFPEMQSKRRALVRRYRERLSHIDGLRIVPQRLAESGADHLMIVVLPAHTDRTSVVRHLAQDGISTSVHFQPLHLFDWIARHSEVAPGGLEVASSLSGRVLSLPLHTGLSSQDVDRVVARLDRAIQT